jgi:hypothetical protein
MPEAITAILIGLGLLAAASAIIGALWLLIGGLVYLSNRFVRDIPEEAWNKATDVTLAVAAVAVCGVLLYLLGFIATTSNMG